MNLLLFLIWSACIIFIALKFNLKVTVKVNNISAKELSELLVQSWESIPLIIREISDFPQHLSALMELVFDDSDPKNWRAAYLVEKIHDQHPELVVPSLPAMTDFLLITQNASKKRHLLKLISLHPIPEDRMVDMLNYCIDVFTSAAEPVAVRVHAMQVLFNIAQVEPDFSGELIELIQHEIEFHGSAGISSRGKKLLKKLAHLDNSI